MIKLLCTVGLYSLTSVSGPDFVGAVEDEDYVYFFFREEAVEFINCGKVSMRGPNSNLMIDVDPCANFFIILSL